MVGLGIGFWVAREDAPLPDPGVSPAAKPRVSATPAPRLEGLAYLPPDANIVFAVQPGPVLAHAVRHGLDPDELLTRIGLPRPVIATVASLGLTWPQIDHIVGSTHVGNQALELRLTLVLALRQPLPDEDDFLNRMKARKLPGGKTRYETNLSGLPMTLARLSPTVWVFGYDMKKDLQSAENGERPAGGTHLPAGVLEMIRERVPPEAAAWLATNDERWGDKPGVKLILEAVLNRPEWLPLLRQGRAVLVALSFDDPPRLRLFVKAADELVGQRVREALARRATDERAWHGGAGELALFDTPIDPTVAYATIQQLLGEAMPK